MTYNLGNGQSGTGTSGNSHNRSPPCLTLNYHTQTLVDLNQFMYQVVWKSTHLKQFPFRYNLHVNYDSPSLACPVNTAPSHYTLQHRPPNSTVGLRPMGNMKIPNHRFFPVSMLVCCTLLYCASLLSRTLRGTLA